MFSVIQLLENSGDPTWYDPGFRRMLEVHLPVFQFHPDVRFEELGPEQVYQYEGDFTGLLTSVSVEAEHRWLYTRFNGYDHPYQFGLESFSTHQQSDGYQLRHPPIRAIQSLMDQWMTRR